MITARDAQMFDLAREVSRRSKDRSKQVGAVIADANGEIITVGYNSFPRGARDDVDGRHERPDKYLWTEHAERNAIYEAARTGVSLEGSTMYVPWFPCMDCARGIVQSGIRRLVAIEPDTTDLRWGGHFRAALQLLDEAGVEISWVLNEP